MSKQETYAEALKFAGLEWWWNDFRAQTIHPEACETQVTEMKRAFYAGASLVLAQLVIIGDTMDEETGAGVLNALHEDCARFAQNELGATFKDTRSH